jgi:hypothetical protein
MIALSFWLEVWALLLLAFCVAAGDLGIQILTADSELVRDDSNYTNVETTAG